MRAASHSPPSLKDVAKKMGLSLMTVSYALRPRKKGERAICSEETVERVQETALKMGYIPNRAARAMRTRQSGVIGFVEPHFSVLPGLQPDFSAISSPFLVGLTHSMTPVGRHVAVVELNELEVSQTGKLPSAFRERFFDGLVIQHGLSDAAVQLLKEHKIPVIYWDSGIFAPYNCINRNEFEAARLATQRLLELGHTRIAFHVGEASSWREFLGGTPRHFSYADRYKGYTTAMKEGGLKPQVLTGYDPQGVANQIIAHRLTGIVWQAKWHVVLAQAAAILKKRIPKDISSISCDLDPSIAFRGDLTGGAVYDRYEIGVTAGRMLLELLKEDAKPVPSLSIPVEYVVDGAYLAQAPRT